MIILFSFVLQAVSYEFQSKAGNLLGKKTYRTFLVINGVVGPVLLGGAVATFFTGSDFYINKANMHRRNWNCKTRGKKRRKLLQM